MTTTIVRGVNFFKKYQINNIKLQGLTLRKPKRFKVSLDFSVANSIAVYLVIPNDDLKWDNLRLDLGNLSWDKLPKFYITTKCLLSNGTRIDTVVENSLAKVLAGAKNTRVIISKKEDDIVVELFMGKFKGMANIEGDWKGLFVEFI